MKLIKEETCRGFDIYRFKDLYNEPCRLQKSSLATQKAIWFGVTENSIHLNQKQVEELIPILQKFVDTGEL